MSFTVFLGNLPTWVSKDDIEGWLNAEGLCADSVKVIRNHETQESKGFAFVEAPTQDEMQSIIKRFDRAPLEDRLLRANAAQPTKARAPGGAPTASSPAVSSPSPAGRPVRPGGKPPRRREKETTPKSAFATELANSLTR